MNYAIIAAGQGSRLAQEGANVPKPLVTLNGEPLIGRLIRIFTQNNAESISVIVNEEAKEVRSYLESLAVDCELNVVVKTTPSSMHSFYELSKVMKQGRFCLTTVDTVFREDEFAEFIKIFEEQEEYDGLMAVTPFVDDEKPLYVEVDEDKNIKAFLDERVSEGLLVSGGVYALGDEAREVLADCVEKGVHRMRNYQRALLMSGLKLKAHSIDKIIDVDHVSDIASAEELLLDE
ncbi:MAG: NTP transferase domain-containing protein [Muribaculaceae bacterium]|jgi:NDP-sugar pyrophosphorylase family protein|nr:NTP transferase domain-containing protein [Muribaculaceae bacterium]MEE1337641.1 NTP transferase domain-containing protein [Muribaculaceae bacterium]